MSHTCKPRLQSGSIQLLPCLIVKQPTTVVALACRAPEKLGQEDDSHVEYGPAVDVWALGILMLQVVASDVRQPYPSGMTPRNMFIQVSLLQAVLLHLPSPLV